MAKRPAASRFTKGPKNEEPIEPDREPLPDASSPVRESPAKKEPDGEAEKNELDGVAGERGKVLETKAFDDGWKRLQHQTEKGRKYFKFIHPDGQTFFSYKKAKEQGYPD